MRIVITGAGGMLGRALAEIFRDGNTLLLWDRAELDITDADAVLRSIGKTRPDVVINAAAYTDVDGAESHEDLARRVNGDAVAYLARACAMVDAALVHYSTDYVFDGENASGYREDDVPTRAVNAYGRSKRLGEKALLRNAHGNLHAYLIRTSWLYGPHGKNFVDTIVRLGREQEAFSARTMPSSASAASAARELRVVDDQHGKPTYTFDLASTTRELLEGRFPPGIYHVTNETPPEGITWYVFALEILRFAGVSARVIPCASDEYPRPARRPTYSMLVNTKLPPRRPWRDALAAYLRG